MSLAARATNALRHLVAGTLAWPSACQVCGLWPSHPLCAACLTRFAPAIERCPRCAAPHDSGLCAPCRARPDPEAGPETCFAAVDYRYPWDGLVARFKFRGEAGWAGPFAERLLATRGVIERLDTADWLVPVPLTPARLAERGHHPPWELVKALRQRHPRPVCADALVRWRDGAAQHRLARAERLHNLHGAFAVPAQRQAVLAGARVLLVDDVVTTGATLQAAAQVLRAAGARRVDALVFARTPARGDPAP
jgi:ComF family protein